MPRQGSCPARRRGPEVLHKTVVSEVRSEYISMLTFHESQRTFIVHPVGFWFLNEIIYREPIRKIEFNEN